MQQAISQVALHRSWNFNLWPARHTATVREHKNTVSCDIYVPQFHLCQWGRTTIPNTPQESAPLLTLEMQPKALGATEDVPAT